MPVFWLSDEHIAFPPPELTSEEGILAVGGDLSPQRLLRAYQMGIFPWFNEQDPILWWCPDPRFVLFPNDLKVSKSMRPYFNQRKFEVTFDQCFEQVIKACAADTRRGQSQGTWITDTMIEGYLRLHELGFAHSVEVWKAKELVGGLYGVSLGKVFFGESMFAKASNASKFGFISLVQKLKAWDFQLIDCQQQTKHLASLGAKSIARSTFLQLLKENEKKETKRGKWSEEGG